MKEKISDDTSHIDGLPEGTQESEEGKIKLLDVVALRRDVPEHNLKRGDIGMVVEIFQTVKRMKLNSEMATGTSVLVLLLLNLECFHTKR